MEEKVRQKRQDVERGLALLQRRDLELRALEKEVEDADRMLCRGDVVVGVPLTDVSPEHFMDMFHRLQNRLRLQEMRNAMLARERIDTAVLCKQLDYELESLECINIQIRAATGFSSVCKTSSLAQVEQEYVIKELYFLITTIEKELLASKTLIAWKQEAIARLMEMADAHEAVLEKQAAVMNDYNVHEAEILLLDLELEQLQEMTAKTDSKLVVVQQAAKELTASSYLKSDIDFLKEKAAQLAEMRKEKETMAKMQCKYLREREEFYDTITVALHDLNLWKAVEKKLKNTMVALPPETLSYDWHPHPDPRISLAFYKLLSKDTEALKATIASKESLLRDKAAAVDTMEDKLDQMLEDNYRFLMESNKNMRSVERKVMRIYDEVWGERQRHHVEISNLHKRKHNRRREYEALIEKIKALSKLHLQGGGAGGEGSTNGVRGSGPQTPLKVLATPPSPRVQGQHHPHPHPHHPHPHHHHQGASPPPASLSFHFSSSSVHKRPKAARPPPPTPSPAPSPAVVRSLTASTLKRRVPSSAHKPVGARHPTAMSRSKSTPAAGGGGSMKRPLQGIFAPKPHLKDNDDPVSSRSELEATVQGEKRRDEEEELGEGDQVEERIGGGGDGDGGGPLSISLETKFDLVEEGS